MYKNILSLLISCLVALFYAAACFSQSNISAKVFSLDDRVKSDLWDLMFVGHNGGILLAGTSWIKSKNGFESREKRKMVNLYSIDKEGSLQWELHLNSVNNPTLNKGVMSGRKNYCFALFNRENETQSFSLLNISKSGKILSKFYYQFNNPELDKQIEEHEYIPLFGDDEGNCSILLPIRQDERVILKLLHISLDGKKVYEQNINLKNGKTFMVLPVNKSSFILSVSTGTRLKLVESILSGKVAENYLEDSSVKLKIFQPTTRNSFNEKTIYEDLTKGKIVNDLLDVNGFIVTGGLVGTNGTSNPSVTKLDRKGKVVWEYSELHINSGYNKVTVVRYDMHKDRLLLAYSDDNAQIWLDSIDNETGLRKAHRRIDIKGNLIDFIVLDNQTVLLMYLTLEGEHFVELKIPA